MGAVLILSLYGNMERCEVYNIVSENPASKCLYQYSNVVEHKGSGSRCRYPLYSRLKRLAQ
mgnify:CR=1 FL=1